MIVINRICSSLHWASFSLNISIAIIEVTQHRTHILFGNVSENPYFDIGFVLLVKILDNEEAGKLVVISNPRMMSDRVHQLAKSDRRGL